MLMPRYDTSYSGWNDVYVRHLHWRQVHIIHLKSGPQILARHAVSVHEISPMHVNALADTYAMCLQAFLEEGQYAHEHTVRARMQPGQCMVFNNRRMLHGREAFSGNGKRHMQVLYTCLLHTTACAIWMSLHDLLC